MSSMFRLSGGEGRGGGGSMRDKLRTVILSSTDKKLNTLASKEHVEMNLRFAFSAAATRENGTYP